MLTYFIALNDRVYDHQQCKETAKSLFNTISMENDIFSQDGQL